jgi:hypothetical protein
MRFGVRNLNDFIKNNLVAVTITAAVLTRLIFIVYTHYTAEDAFITFQFSHRLAQGMGFVYNPGQPIYGTTTPLFTLLLAGWLKISSDPRLGAWMLDLAAFAGTMVFTSLSLEKLGVSKTRQCLVIVLFALSSRLWTADIGGMETPLLILLMAISWYAVACGSFVWAGIASGFLLWTRIDLGFWVLVLAFSAFRRNFKTGLLYSVITVGIYLPWLIYATIVFGSPIPNTIAAKAIAYSGVEYNNLYSHFMVLFRLFSLSDLAIEQFKLTNLISICMIAFMLWALFRQRREASILMLVLFIIIEGTVLVLYRTTYFLRYFVPLLWAFQVLAGLTLGELWDMAGERSLINGALLSVVFATALVSAISLILFYATPLPILESFLDFVLYIWLGFFVISGLVFSYKYYNKKPLLSPHVVKSILVAYLVVFTLLGFENAKLVRFLQANRHEASLTRIGLWLNQNTPVDATVMLEPLGYIGYYADRIMMDEVGLVTPEIVSLKAQGVRKTEEYYRILKPDYVVVHCDDSLIMQTKGSGVLVSEYGFQIAINPLDYDPSDDDHSAKGIFSRNACYEIWKRH